MGAFIQGYFLRSEKNQVAILTRFLTLSSPFWQCKHPFCGPCLHGLLQTDLTIVCPTCAFRTAAYLGVERLPKDDSIMGKLLYNQAPSLAPDHHAASAPFVPQLPLPAAGSVAGIYPLFTPKKPESVTPSSSSHQGILLRLFFIPWGAGSVVYLCSFFPGIYSFACRNRSSFGKKTAMCLSHFPPFSSLICVNFQMRLSRPRPRNMWCGLIQIRTGKMRKSPNCSFMAKDR